jgi:hypothetical protein
VLSLHGPAVLKTIFLSARFHLDVSLMLCLLCIWWNKPWLRFFLFFFHDVWVIGISVEGTRNLASDMGLILGNGEYHLGFEDE